MSPFPSLQLWTLALERALVSAPAYDQSRGYFPVEGDRIAAFDLELGTERWITSGRPHVAPIVGEGLLFAAEPSALTALRTADGSVAWRVSRSETPWLQLSWSNGRLIAATATAVEAIQAADGTLLWRRELGSAVHAAPVLAGKRVYLPLEDGRVVALGVEDGDAVWERRLGDAANEIRSASDRLFVGSNDNFLYCLRAEDGEIQWRWRTGGDVVGTPLIDERRVYFVALDNVLRALNQTNGVQQWKRALSFRPASGPVRGGSVLIVSGLAGPAQAFQMKDGAPAGDLSYGTGVELASRLHVFEGGVLGWPTLVVVTRGLAAGTTVAAFRRSIEPPLIPILEPLPALVPVTVPTEK